MKLNISIFIAIVSVIAGFVMIIASGGRQDGLGPIACGSLLLIAITFIEEEDLYDGVMYQASKQAAKNVANEWTKIYEDVILTLKKEVSPEDFDRIYKDTLWIVKKKPKYFIHWIRSLENFLVLIRTFEDVENQPDFVATSKLMLFLEDRLLFHNVAFTKKGFFTKGRLAWYSPQCEIKYEDIKSMEIERSDNMWKLLFTIKSSEDVYAYYLDDRDFLQEVAIIENIINTIKNKQLEEKEN